jgi:Mycothiol maleylpyruvate isomerase N-terminal domain
LADELGLAIGIVVVFELEHLVGRSPFGSLAREGVVEALTLERLLRRRPSQFRAERVVGPHDLGLELVAFAVVVSRIIRTHGSSFGRRAVVIDGTRVAVIVIVVEGEATLAGRHTAGVSNDNRDDDLQGTEERLWTELHELVDSLPPGKATEPGYFAEGWSAKDLVAHVGSWLAEAGVLLEQIASGTYHAEETDVDAMNAMFYEAMRDVAFSDVRAQAFTARERMLRAWGALVEPSADADRWIAKAGPEHYAEHLPRLREWVAVLV